MKKARKLMAFLLATLMVMGMSMGVLAANANPHTITIDNSTSGYTYEAYQVFAGDYSEAEGVGKLSNITWGVGVNGDELLKALSQATLDGGGENPEYIEEFKDCGSAEDVAKVLAGKTHDDDLAKKFADVVNKHLSATVAGSTNACTEGKYTIQVEGDGYYFVKNTAVPATESSYTRYLLLVVDDATATHKGTYPTADKAIVDNGDKDINEASIGDEIFYKITGTMPENIGDYNTYYYVFTDTLSAGLTYNDNIKVMIGENDVTRYFYKNNNGNVITIGMDDILELENVTAFNPRIDIAAGTEIEITYSATLNENATIAETGNDNSVTLEYSNDPNQSGEGKSNDTPPENPNTPPGTTYPTGDTPTSKVTTYTTEITIHKVDGSSNALAGAAFRITGAGVKTVVTTGEVYVQNVGGTYYKLADGTYTTTIPASADDPLYASTTTKYVKENKTTIDTAVEDVEAEAFVNSAGELTFTGLGAGEYTISEIVTPEGYNSAADITFTISFDPATQKFTSSNPNVAIGADNKFDVTVVNLSGSTLPSTGGMGTTIFYIVGGVLVLVAVVLLVTRKRMKKEEA